MQQEEIVSQIVTVFLFERSCGRLSPFCVFHCEPCGCSTSNLLNSKNKNPHYKYVLKQRIVIRNLSLMLILKSQITVLKCNVPLSLGHVFQDPQKMPKPCVVLSPVLTLFSAACSAVLPQGASSLSSHAALPGASFASLLLCSLSLSRTRVP